MSQGIILHLFGWDKKFVPSFIDIIRRNFSTARHKFAIYGKLDKSEGIFPENSVIYFDLLKDFFALSKELNKAEKIIFHGLFNNHLFYIIFLQPWLLRKCYWVIWGGDLYVHEIQGTGWRWEKDEFLRRFIIRRIGNLVTYISGDVDLARKWYGAKGRHIECLVYPSNVFNVPIELNQTTSEIKTVLIGNSADPSNNHLEIFAALSALEDKKFQLICPLSYGDKVHAAIVVKEGIRLFGDRFVPLLDFMPYQDYLVMLGKIDIAIFAHRRQQGMGNTVSLLGLGKKVYMREDISSFSLLKSLGFHLGKISDLDLKPLDNYLAKKNQEICLNYFSRENLLKQLDNVFEGEYGVP